jgi:predicted enzyme related to lactoylglutathione lyase
MATKSPKKTRSTRATAKKRAAKKSTTIHAGMKRSASRKASSKAARKVEKPARAVRARKQVPPEAMSKDAGNDVPSLFRINVEVGDLDHAVDFYTTLFGIQGRRQAGSRCYFTCGPVTLQVVDVSSVGPPHPAAKALYFTVTDLDALFERAQALGCLSQEDVHGVSGGGISVRPWGERSFYAEDRWGNPLCFVEAGTLYAG